MENNIASVICGRRTIHEFKPDAQVPESIMIRAVEHAICAPNHYRTRPWRFYLLKGQTIKTICQLNAGLAGAGKGRAEAEKIAQLKRERWLAIPGWLLLSCTISEDAVRMDEDYAACCCAAQNMMLYLWAQGIGMKWTSGAVTRDDAFFRLLRIDPAEEKVVGLFWYGYPKQTAGQTAGQTLGELPAHKRPSAADCLYYR